MNDPAFQQAFAEQNRRDQISTSTLASILSIILMPAGAIMDYFVYETKVWTFLQLRICSSLLVGLFWLFFLSRFGKRHYKLFGVMWFMFPVIFIELMIYLANDAAAPYYAGLNIVLLALGLLSPWTYRQNLISALIVIGLYLLASFAMPKHPSHAAIFNNLYFLTATATIVIFGTHAHYKQRFREFELRWELDNSRKTVEEAHRKLKELDEAKSRFFANISHELRTPLTLLIAPLENLMRRFGSQADQDTQNLLGTMQSNGMRLLKLINDLLDLVRLESGVLVVKRAPLDMPDFAKGLISAVRQVAEDKRIRLELFVDPALGLVMADRDKLEKIILNLLFNALKFTPAGGTVELRVEKVESELVLIVRDTGVGISEKNLPNVFSRFWQADDSSRRKYQGVGIGLALVKELTEVQGGSASVASVQGQGTTFTVRLSYERVQAAAPAPEAQDEGQINLNPDGSSNSAGTVTSQEWLSNLYRRAELFPAMTAVQDALRPVETGLNGRSPKVLIADDEPDMLRFLKSQLQAQYQIIEAVDGQQAVDKASQFLPDIILLDMMMPEKDGLQACKELRERTHTQSIPVILLTARADEETKLAALSAGASDFLPKPFSTTELHVRIKNLVESFDYQRKLSKQNNVLESTIEQLKETETQLVQTEKLASLGRMSAGIIHEINNPLNFATTGIYTLRQKAQHMLPEERAEYSEILKDVEDGLSRVKTIVSDLRSFSHHENQQVDELEVSELVKSSLRFLSQEYKDKVLMHEDIATGQKIWANRNKMIQVLVNIVQNAMDALKGKEFAPEEKPTVTIQGRIEDGKSLLIIRDNGPGIASNILDKIFDPFFTTKDVGQGMGLGLSICYRIVQEYSGRILVKSEPGKFCEFTLEFPATRQSEEPEVTVTKQSYAA